jgi:hypothetical protein
MRQRTRNFMIAPDKWVETAEHASCPMTSGGSRVPSLTGSP